MILTQSLKIDFSDAMAVVYDFDKLSPVLL